MSILSVCLILLLSAGTVRVRAEGGGLSTLDLSGLTAKQLKQAQAVIGFTDNQAAYEAAYAKALKKKPYTKAELREMACLIYAEANSMEHDAMAAVANSVLNRRADEDKYGYVNTIHDVIYDHKWGYQFSPVIDGSLKKAFAIYDSMDPAECKEWQITAMTNCIEAAKAALCGYKSIPDDFMYFNSHLESQKKKCIENGWSFIILDRHIYYKNTSDAE